MQKNILSKIWPIIKKYKLLRTLSLLIVIFVILSVIFFSGNIAYSNKIEANQKKVNENEQALQSLQRLILNKDSTGGMDMDIFQNKSFASYDEVIPFIALLESMMSPVDLSAEIAVKSQEDQIFVNHYADYSVKIKVSQKDLLIKALQDISDSRFITKISDFSMNYSLSADGANDFTQFEFTIRLFLK